MVFNRFGLAKNNDFNDIQDNNDGLKQKTLRVNAMWCPQNHPCPSIRVCPVGALTQKGFKAPEVDNDQCIKCGKCVRYCPMGAISLS